MVHDYSRNFREADALPVHAGPHVQALDVSVLQAKSLDNWQENFHWPISDSLFDEFVEAVFEAYLELSNSVDAIDRMLVLSDLSFVAEVVQHAHLKAAETAFEREGERAVVGQISGSVLAPDWESLAAEYEQVSGPGYRFKVGVRGRVKTWVFNPQASPHRRLKAMLRPGSDLVIGSFTPLMADFLRDTDEAVSYVFVDAFLPRKVGPVAVSPKLTQGVIGFLAGVAGLVEKKFGAKLDEPTLVSCWLRRLSALAGIARHVRENSRAPRILYLSNIDLALHRLVAQIWQGSGTEVIGFHHGNDMGLEPSLFTGLVEFGLCDKFVAPTKKSAEWLDWVYRSGPMIGNTEFVSAETGRYRRLRETLNAPVNAGIRRIMIVSFPFSWIRYPGYSGHFPLFQLDLELNLARTLREDGYHVIVKVHPEWQALATRIWEGRADSLPKVRFEDCWQDADLLLFPRVSTTTFGVALCTNKPILVLEPEANDWNPQALPLLRRRCRMVPVRTDERNRQTFNRDALLDAVREPFPEPDFEYVKSAMFPAGTPE